MYRFKSRRYSKYLRKIPLHRVCRQGDPVSPYIFVLCAELLAEEIRNNENIRGIEIFGSEHVIGQFADDTTLF